MTTKGFILDFSERDAYGEGSRRRRRRKRWNGDYQDKVTRRLRQAGFSSHEIGLWIDEKLPLESRSGQNLIYARRKKMKAYFKEGFDFREAQRKSEEDRIRDGRDEGYNEQEAKDRIWTELYEIDSRERRVTGPMIRVY